MDKDELFDKDEWLDLLHESYEKLDYYACSKAEYNEYKRFIESYIKEKLYFITRKRKNHLIGLPVVIQPDYVKNLGLKTNIGIIKSANEDYIVVKAVRKDSILTELSLDNNEYRLLSGGI